MKRLFATFLAVSAAAGLAYRVGLARAAGIPQTGTLSYTGTLLSFGQADNNARNLTVNLWVNGTVACTTTPAAPVQLTNGRFTVPLDSSCVPVVHQNQNVQVEVIVDTVSMGLTPLGAVPYAVESDTASNAATGSALSQLVPSGSVMAFAGPVSGGTAAPPAGWLVCNGQAVSRTQYAALFAAIGTSSGVGDGSTTFNLPDYQGYFLRGVDNGTGRDPDTASRVAPTGGGNTGDAVGSIEPDAFASHSHGVNDPGHDHGGSTTGVNNAGGATDGNRDWANNGCGNKGFNYSLYCSVSSSFNAHTHAIPAGTTGISLQNSGGSETRPANAYVNYIIKS